jgi:Elongation factor Tu GTP binding domain
MSASSSSFSTGSSSFVPKSKQAAQPVASNESFPALGGEAPKKTAAPAKKEPEDPCFGKQKEFFIYEYDPASNICICSTEQLSFIATYYMEHYFTPIDILMWLYDMAEYKEACEYDAIYNSRPQKTTTTTGAKSKTKKAIEEIDDNEESTFGIKSYKDMKKLQKPSAPPKQPGAAGGKQLTEAQKEEQRLAKLKKMQEDQRLKEEKASKDVVGREKTLDQLLAGQAEPFVEYDETKSPVSMVCIGHVDAGKSTISGNIMLETGVIDARTMQKYKEEAKEKNRESWFLAYAMDVCEEEKAKGKTVEMGRANFDTEKKRVTVFDAPGHKNYVPNMIMGAALADYGALVISAKKGEFEAGFEADG